MAMVKERKNDCLMCLEFRTGFGRQMNMHGDGAMAQRHNKAATSIHVIIILFNPQIINGYNGIASTYNEIESQKCRSDR